MGQLILFKMHHAMVQQTIDSKSMVITTLDAGLLESDFDRNNNHKILFEIQNDYAHY